MNKEQLRESIRELPEINNPYTFWDYNRVQLRELILTADIDNFLSWPCVQSTMCVHNAPYIEKELEYLHKHNDENNLWYTWMEDDLQIGTPPKTNINRISENSIHHAYSLKRFQDATGAKIKDYDMIFEFGGGYGNMARIIYNLGFKGDYFIYDLPEFSILQEYYLSKYDLHEDARTNINLNWFADYLETFDFSDKKLFIATWSLSEAPIELREQIFDMVQDFDWLITFQTQFKTINNLEYFMRQDGEIIPIDHIPGNYYFFSEKLIR